MNQLVEEKQVLADGICEAQEQKPADEVQTALNYWLLENMKIMEKLTVKEPVSWSEQDWGG